MSCKKWEQSIYLYEELTPEERGQLDIHLQQCMPCTRLFQSVLQMQSIVKASSGNKAVVKDAVLLSNKIMRSVQAESASGAEPARLFNTLINGVFTRYALGATSLVLIFFFVSEQQREIRLPNPELAHSGYGASARLDTQAFMKAIKQEKPAESSLYLCIKSNQCDNGIVKMFKQKKNHENL